MVVQIETFWCKLCESVYQSNEGLMDHMRIVHEFLCWICDKLFGTSDRFRQHVREIHYKSLEEFEVEYNVCLFPLKWKLGLYTGVSSKARCYKRRIACPENGCQEKFRYLLQLTNHLLENHSEEMSETTFQVPTFQDFVTWKDELIAESGVGYTKKRGVKFSYTKAKKTHTFYCSRSGFYEPRGKGIRQLKTQGSSKINNYCTSKIKVVECKNTRICTVTLFHNHLGHDINFETLAHTPLSKQDKDTIAVKITKDVPKMKIIEDIRNYGANNRSKIITSQDIDNVARDYNLHNLEIPYDGCEFFSTELLLQEKGNDILFFKNRGEKCEKYPELKEDDFVLVISTKMQRKIFSQHIADNHKLVISMDATHGISSSGFQATTLMHIDDLHHGFPDAMCISSTVNEKIISCFLNEVKSIFGELTAYIFMSDDDGTFRNAWRNVMGAMSILYCLICVFHVERSFLRKINSTQGLDSATKSYIIRTCKDLLYNIRDMETFWITVRELLAILDMKEQIGLIEYFIKYYLKEERVVMWARYCRIGIHIHTNNHIESFHCILKHKFFFGKKIKRLDKCLIAIFKFLDDRVYKRLTDLVKHKNCRLSVIKSHEESLALTVTEMREGHFVVTSDYTQILVQSKDKCTDCRGRCNICQVCIHMYNCPCYTNSKEICKHIHAVHSYVSARDREYFVAKDANKEIDMIMAELYSPYISQKDVISKELEKIKELFVTISNKVENGRPQATGVIIQQLQKLDATVNASLKNPEGLPAKKVVKSRIPHNKKLSPQRKQSKRKNKSKAVTKIVNIFPL